MTPINVDRYLEMRYKSNGIEVALEPGAIYITALNDLTQQIASYLLKNDVEIASLLTKVKEAVWVRYQEELDDIYEYKQEARWADANDY